MKTKNVITALDIGTTKICAIIAEVTDHNKLNIKGIGIAESHGLEKGIVKDIQKASDSIQEALSLAEQEAKMHAVNIYAGIAGEHIRSQNAIGQISVSDSNYLEPQEITQQHVEKVISNANSLVKNQQGNENLQIIHGIPQYYDIDHQNGIINPINMSGFNLTAHVHVVMANIGAVRNIQKCIQLSNYKVKELVLEPIASAYSVLNEDEKDLGCILIDIGGGTTDVAIFYKGSIRFSKIKPIGGNNVTQDLSIGLRTPPKSAEQIKISNGNAISQKVDENELVDIQGIGGRDISQKHLKFISEIIEFRMRETLELAYKTVINSYHQELMTAGLILTGGASLLKNIDCLAFDIFNMPVKIGYPNLNRLNNQIAQLNNPKFSTSVGLLYYGLDEILKTSNIGKHGNEKVTDQFISAFQKLIKNLSEYI